METLAVILNCRWQVKRLNAPINNVRKENIVFFAKKKKTTTKKETIKKGNKIEYNTKPKKNLVTSELEHLKRKDRLEDFSHPP